jgi:hypothetical protein
MTCLSPKPLADLIAVGDTSMRDSADICERQLGAITATESDYRLHAMLRTSVQDVGLKRASSPVEPGPEVMPRRYRGSQ